MTLTSRYAFSHSRWFVWIGGVVWTVVHLIQHADGLPWIINIDPDDDECFLVKVPSTTTNFGKFLVGDYELFRHERQGKVSADPLLVYIQENSKSETIQWRSKPGEPRGSFRVPIAKNTPGYWICFQNSAHGPDNTEPEEEHPDHITRTVGFDFRVDSIMPDVKPSPVLFTTDHSDEWRDKSYDVQEELRSMMHHRDYMRMREADHRALVEKTFASTLVWTLIEAGVVIVMATGQVLYFRRFLERKTTFLSNHRY